MDVEIKFVRKLVLKKAICNMVSVLVMAPVTVKHLASVLVMVPVMVSPFNRDCKMVLVQEANMAWDKALAKVLEPVALVTVRVLELAQAQTMVLDKVLVRVAVPVALDSAWDLVKVFMMAKVCTTALASMTKN
jgi:hypothetical protein